MCQQATNARLGEWISQAALSTSSWHVIRPSVANLGGENPIIRLLQRAFQNTTVPITFGDYRSIGGNPSSKFVGAALMPMSFISRSVWIIEDSKPLSEGVNHLPFVPCTRRMRIVFKEEVANSTTVRCAIFKNLADISFNYIQLIDSEFLDYAAWIRSMQSSLKEATPFII